MYTYIYAVRGKQTRGGKVHTVIRRVVRPRAVLRYILTATAAAAVARCRQPLLLYYTTIYHYHGIYTCNNHDLGKRTVGVGRRPCDSDDPSSSAAAAILPLGVVLSRFILVPIYIYIMCVFTGVVLVVGVGGAGERGRQTTRCRTVFKGLVRGTRERKKKPSVWPFAGNP